MKCVLHQRRVTEAEGGKHSNHTGCGHLPGSPTRGTRPVAVRPSVDRPCEDRLWPCSSRALARNPGHKGSKGKAEKLLRVWEERRQQRALFLRLILILIPHLQLLLSLGLWCFLNAPAALLVDSQAHLVGRISNTFEVKTLRLREVKHLAPDSTAKKRIKLSLALGQRYSQVLASELLLDHRNGAFIPTRNTEQQGDRATLFCKVAWC